MKILLVDDESDILEVLMEYLELGNHEVLTATNGKEALDLVLADPSYDAIFSDIKMPVMDGLTFLEKLRIHEISLPVVLISGQGDLETSIRALKLGAIDFIVKPVHLKSLSDSLEKIETSIQMRQESRSAVSLVEEQVITLVCDSKMNNIKRVISYFNKHTQDICLRFGIDDRKIAICLQECLTNAIVHGNFGLSSRLKDSNWTEFDKQVTSREVMPEYSNKKVKITFQLLPDRIQFEVTDDGDGFDSSELLDPADTNSWLKLSGRGILFIRSYMDKVSWNSKGNSIQVCKLIDSNSP